MRSLTVALFVTTLGILLATAPQGANAETYVCAAVMPSCDADGNPMAPYNNVESPCFEVFAARCQTAKQVSLSCSDRSAKEAAFKKQIRDLKLKLKLATRNKR